MSIVLDGTAGITFPVTAGSASAVQASSGRVLQVVLASTNTSVSTTSTSWTTTGFSASITPSSSSSKILLVSRSPIRGFSSSGNSAFGGLLWYRNGNAIQSPGNFYETGCGAGGSSNMDFRNVISHVILDSPSSTSSVTYTLYLSYYTGTNFEFCPGSLFYADVVLQEIAA
jgi:hypothetical protein